MQPGDEKQHKISQDAERGKAQVVVLLGERPGRHGTTHSAERGSSLVEHCRHPTRTIVVLEQHTERRCHPVGGGILIFALTVDGLKISLGNGADQLSRRSSPATMGTGGDSIGQWRTVTGRACREKWRV